MCNLIHSISDHVADSFWLDTETVARFFSSKFPNTIFIILRVKFLVKFRARFDQSFPQFHVFFLLCYPISSATTWSPLLPCNYFLRMPLLNPAPTFWGIPMTFIKNSILILLFVFVIRINILQELLNFAFFILPFDKPCNKKYNEAFLLLWWCM